MLNEPSDREPQPADRPLVAYAVAGIAALAMLAQLATCVADHV